MKNGATEVTPFRRLFIWLLVFALNDATDKPEDNQEEE